MHQHSSLLINGNWIDGEGPVFESFNPADNSRIWQGQAASHQQIATAVNVARQALQHWREHRPEQRCFQLRQFLHQLQQHQLLLSDTLAQESGQTLSAARRELQSLEQLIESYLAQSSDPGNGDNPCGVGVVVLISSFSQPMISVLRAMIPILLAGNTLVFKPSEFSPRCAELVLHLWLRADLPDGVINLLQGGPEVALGLAQQEAIDGIHFTGQRSHALQLHQLLAGRPEVALQLHTGGNNHLYVDSQQDPAQLLPAIISSAFANAGQHCCAARCLLLDHSEEADQLLLRLQQSLTEGLEGSADIGPVIDARAARQLIQRQQQLLQQGARTLLPMQSADDNDCQLSAGIIDISTLAQIPETEIYGPLLQVIRVRDGDEAISRINRNREQLVDAVFSEDPLLCQRMLQQFHSPLLSSNMPLDQIMLQPDLRLWRSAAYSNSRFTRPRLRFCG